MCLHCTFFFPVLLPFCQVLFHQPHFPAGWVQSAALPGLLVRGVHGQKSPSVHQPSRPPLKSSTGPAPRTQAHARNSRTGVPSLQQRGDEEAQEDPTGERLGAARSKHRRRGAAARDGWLILKPVFLARAPSEQTPFIPRTSPGPHTLPPLMLAGSLAETHSRTTSPDQATVVEFTAPPPPPYTLLLSGWSRSNWLRWAWPARVLTLQRTLQPFASHSGYICIPSPACLGCGRGQSLCGPHKGGGGRWEGG